MSREGVCVRCGHAYPVWYADNDLWNPVMRDHDGNERWPFVCPTCFVTEATLSGVDVIWRVTTGDACG